MAKERMLGQLGSRLGLAVSVCVLAVLVLAAFFPALLSPIDPAAQDWVHRLQPPNAMTKEGKRFLLGTDQLGRDILARLLAGTRVSLTIALGSALGASALGVTLGLISGFQGGWVRDIITRVTLVQLSLPYILLALAIIGILGPSIPRLILVLSLAGWPTFARVVGAETAVVRELPYIEAARALGMRPIRIFMRHVLPNVAWSIIVLVTFAMATMIVAEAGLSFLGLGVPPQVPSWGAMLSEGRALLAVAWWLGTLPGLAIFVTATSFNLLGDYLRDRLDPRLRGMD